MEHIRKQVEELIKQSRRGKIRKTLSMVMACIVVFTTVYWGILPAITMNVDTAADMPGVDLIIDEAELEAWRTETLQGTAGNSGNSDDTAFDGLMIQTVEEVDNYDAEEYLGREDTWEYRQNGSTDPKDKTPVTDPINPESSASVMEPQNPESDPDDGIFVISEEEPETEEQTESAAESFIEAETEVIVELSEDSEKEDPSEPIVESDTEAPFEQETATSIVPEVQIPAEPVTEATDRKESESETDPELQAMIETEPGAEAETVIETEPETETQLVIETEPETEVQTVIDTEPETVVQPMIGAEPETETQPVIEEEPETEVQPELQPVTETDSEMETQCVNETEPKSEIQPVTETEPETEVQPETQPMTETEPKTEVRPVIETETETEVQLELQPVTETEPKTEVQPETQPMTETEPETEVQLMTEAEPETAVQLMTEAEPETEAQPVAETEPETEVQLETQPMTEEEPETETRLVIEAESETEAQPVAETEPETQPMTEAEPETEVQPVTESEPEMKVQPELQPLTETEPETEVQPETQPMTEKEPETEVQTAIVAEPETEAQPMNETEPETEVQPETQPMTEEEPETEVQSVPETEPGTEVQPETQTVTEAEPETETTQKTLGELYGEGESRAVIVTPQGKRTETEQSTEDETEYETEDTDEITERITIVSEETFDFPEEVEMESEMAQGTEQESEISDWGEFFRNLDHEPETESEPEHIKWTEDDMILKSETDSGKETELESEFATELRSEVEPDTEIESKAEFETETEIEIETEFETETETKFETETETESETVIETESESVIETESESEMESESETETEIESESETETEWVSEPEIQLSYPAQRFDASTETVRVRVVAEEGAFPKGTTMTVEDVEDDDTMLAITDAVENRVSKVHAVNITFYNVDGKEIEPLIPIRVVMTAEESDVTEEVQVVHVDNDGNAETVSDARVTERNGDVHAQLMESGTPVELAGSAGSVGTVESAESVGPVGSVESTRVEIVEESSEAEVVFEADQFSIYALVYTVDFEYSVDGKIYRFSLLGGGFVSLTDLVEVLGIIGDTDSGDNEAVIEEAEPQDADRLIDAAENDAAKKFVADVESVEFSSPELVFVGKTDTGTTVGALKEANGLECEYSAELTEAQIEAINHTVIRSGDWVLISMLPFDTEETLIVTMKNGEAFTVKVTDAQISTQVITAKGERFRITVTYDEEAKIPEGSVLVAEEITEGSEKYETYWEETAEKWTETDREGYISFARFFDIEIRKDGTKIEPEAPVEVEIVHEDGLVLFEEENLSIIHFAEKGTEIIDEIHRNENGTEVIYEQNGFSVIGTIAVTNANNWPTQNGQYVVVLQNGEEYYAVSQDGTLRRVKYFNDTISFIGSGTTTLDYIDDYLWYFTASGNARGYLSTEAGTTGNGTFIDPYNSAGLSTTHRQLRTQNNMIYTTGYSDGSVRYYTLSASAGEGGKIAQTDLYGDDASRIYYVPYSSFSANDNETELYTQIDVEALIEKWRRQMTQDLTVDKTAEVYDYDNRIYRVDIEASSGYYEISPSIALEFVVDCSRSMYFPSKLEQVGTYTTTSGNDSTEAQGIRNWITANGRQDQVYYFITDPNSAADVYAIWYDGGKGWCFGNASYYHTKDSTVLGMRGGIYGHLYNKSLYVPDPYQNSSLGDGRHPDDLTVLNSRSFDGKIYTSDAVVEGQPWNRLDYLKLAVEAAAKVVYAVDADAQIGLVKFAATATDLGTWGKEDQEEFYTALRQISVIGGTNPRDGLEEVIENYTDNSTRQQVVVLVTDGAPNSCTWEEVRTKANTLKAQIVAGKQTEIYTLGLSLENVGSNKQELFTVSSGASYQYDAESGNEIVDCITQIIQTVVIQANLKGIVTDVIDNAFYPVDKLTGRPLSSGDWITLEGEKTTEGAEDAVGKVTDNDGVWTIEWEDQRFDWPTTDESGNMIEPGWHGTVFVKSREDFLGGNGIRTNGAGSKVEAVKFIDHSGQEVVLTASEADRIEELSTPYVNVDELSFSQNNTEWTVYLGTEVDPLEAVKALYDKINVREVVSKTTEEDHRMADEGQLVYALSPDSGIDGRAEVNEREEFSLITVADLTDTQWKQLIEGNTVTIDYDAYGHSNVGTIEIRLVQSVVEGEDDLTPSPHDTAKTGSPVETYTLTVKYLPNDAEVSNFHTGAYGTKRPGNDTDDIVSENEHKINVFARNFEILKKDMTNTSKLIDTAKFKLYRLARKQKDPETGAETDEYESGTVDLEVGEETKKVVQIGEEMATSGGKITVENLPYTPDGIYYLVETEAPAGYLMLTEPIVMHLYLDDAYTHYLAPYETITQAQTADNPYNWTQTVNRFSYDSSKTGEVNDTKITIEVMNSPGIELPATGGPGTNLIYLLGILLTGLAGCGMVLKRRRKNAA